MIRNYSLVALAFVAPLMVVSVPVPCSAHVEPAPETYAVTRLEVDVSKLKDGSPMKQSVAKLARAEVTDAMLAELTRRGVTLVDEDAQATLRVSLWWEDYEKSHYGIKAEVIRDGQSRILMTDECELCDEAKVAHVVTDMLSGLMGHLVIEREEPAQVEAPVEPEPAETEPEVEPQTDGPPPEDQPEQPHAKRIGGVGYAGIAAAAAGLGVGIGGLVVAVQTPAERLASNDDTTTEVVNRRPLGLALVGTGAGLVVAGAVLIAVDQTVLRKRRERGTSTTALVPTLSPYGAGLAWVGRF